jgi:signal transduction histidine kinase
MLGAIFVTLIQHLFVQDWAPALPLASVYSFAPLILGLAAWSRVPLDFPGLPRRSSRTWEILPYATFALAATAILLRFLIEGRLARASLIGFILLTFLLLFRQFMLLRDLRKQNYSLERRVKERTQDLEVMQAVLLRTERLNTLSTLGAGIAHDLNNFLGVTQASVQLIEQQLEAIPAALSKHVSRIHASTDRAISLTRRLLGFARKDQEQLGAIDLAQEVAHLEDLLRMLLPSNIGLQMELPPGSFPILSRKSNLEQILVNLICNAKDAMPGGGAVTIRLNALPSPEGPRVQIQVEDTGPGLHPSVLEHLFELFVTTKGEGKGTGLGLPTVKLLVEGDGGTVRVLSSPGEGCKFLVSYPMA